MTHFDDRLSAYLDDELGAAARTAVDAHLAECRPCRDELAAVTLARDAVRNLEWLPLPESIAGRPAVAARRPLRRWRRRLAPALAVTAAVAVFAGFGGATVDNEAPIELEQVVDRHLARVSVDPGPNTVQVRMVVAP